MAKLKIEDVYKPRIVQIKDRIVLGSADTCDIHILHRGVAAEHCAVYCEEGTYWVEHLASEGFTLCNNRVVTRGVLHDGDSLVIGKAKITFMEPDIETDPNLFGKMGESNPGITKLNGPAQIDIADNMSCSARELIITCGVCGRAVNKRLSKCPACGSRISKKRKHKKGLPKGHWSYLSSDFKEISLTTEKLVRCIDEGQVELKTSLRGPTTNYQWLPAGEIIGIAKWLGVCQDCRAQVESWQVYCHLCGVSLEAPED